MTSTFPALLALLTLAATGNLITNGDFEQGLKGWSLSNDWYAKPPGGGLSQMTVADEGHGGGKAIKFVGEGKRGIAMQVFPVYPGKYRVTGWIKCEGLEGVNASVLCEWMSADNQWMRGDTAASATGTTDWKAFDTTVEAPEGARSIHFDLLTSEPNNGSAWFDDIAVARVPAGLPKPQPPVIKAQTAPGAEASLQVTWDPKALSPGAVRVLVYCEEKPLTANAVPVAAADSASGKAVVQSLEVGKTYHLAAAVVNGDGEASARSPEVTAKPQDRQAPRPGWLSAERFGDMVVCEWQAHLLDVDVCRIEWLQGPPEKPTIIKTLTARDLRHLDCFIPNETMRFDELKLPGVERVGIRATDAAGNTGEIAWANVTSDRSYDTLTDVDMWVVPATDNVPKTAEKPANLPAVEPTLMRGQTKGLQVIIRPRRDLRQVKLELLGKSGMQVTGEANFVNYVHLDRNSVATPADELVWPAPGDYPDEISDEPVRDLPAGQAQSVYVDLTAARDAKPRDWGFQLRLCSTEGRATTGFKCRVSRAVLPQRLRLPFVYWFSWAAPCKEFGVEERSADGWRVLGEIGKQMVAHHERVVVVPWSLVRTWRGADGKLTHDFRDFDRYIKTFQSVGVDQLFCLSHIGGRTTGEWECPTMTSHTHEVRDTATGDPLARLDAVELLPALQAHIEKLGLLSRFALHIADEPIAANVESYRELSARAHAAAPKLKRIDAMHVPDLQGSLEKWVPQINYFEQWLPEFRKAQAAGNEVWFYVAWVPQGKYPNRMIDSSAIKPRVLHWLNSLYDTDGYLHWALNHWQIPLNSLNSPGDQYITWPSKRFVGNSSLRYEAEREGLEDCELMFMVRDKYMKQGLTHAQAQAKMELIGREAVQDFQHYTRSWFELERVRAKLLQELSK